MSNLVSRTPRIILLSNSQNRDAIAAWKKNFPQLADNTVFAKLSDVEGHWRELPASITVLWLFDRLDGEASSLIEMFHKFFGPRSEALVWIGTFITLTQRINLSERGVEIVLDTTQVDRAAAIIAQLYARHEKWVLDPKGSYSAVKLCLQARLSDKPAIIAEKLESLFVFARFDVFASLVAAYGYEGVGDFVSVEEKLRHVLNIDGNHFLTQRRLAECLLVLGKASEARDMLKSTAELSWQDARRWGVLAMASVECGDQQTKEDSINKLKACPFFQESLAEVQIYEALHQNKINHAFSLLSQIKGLSAPLVAKFNEVGIARSKSGLHQEALDVYSKTHAQALNDLKYKISLNAALAAHRSGDAKLALSLLDRSQHEYGSSYEKLEKIRASIIKSGLASHQGQTQKVSS